MSDELTIDGLAHAAGVVVSTVRLYQNKGLLPPSTKRGRVAYFGPAHLDRLRLISRLQERGFSLAAIKELLDGFDSGQSLRAVLGLDDDGPSTWATEEPESMSLAELRRRLPEVSFSVRMLNRVRRLGLVELSRGGTRVLVKHPSFLRIGQELARLGVPPAVILDEYEALRAETATIADRFTDVFRTYLWAPAVADGLPAEELARLAGALERLGPLAEGVVGLSLRLALRDAAERFLATEATDLPGVPAGRA